MIILLTIAAAIIGALFWADRRRYYRYRYGPVLVSDEQDLDVDGDAYCDDKVIETRKALVSELASTVEVASKTAPTKSHRDAAGRP